MIIDSVCLEECQKQLRSLYETSSKVRIIPWDHNSAVHIDKIYTDLSWIVDDRTPRGVIQEELDHYTKIFAHKEPRDAPKHIFNFYTDLSWIMLDRTPRRVIQENFDHYTDNFAHREPHEAPKRILVYGQPGK